MWLRYQMSSLWQNLQIRQYLKTWFLELGITQNIAIFKISPTQDASPEPGFCFWNGLKKKKR